MVKKTYKRLQNTMLITLHTAIEVLHVSTIGDDTMQGVPNGKEGNIRYICI